jgi:NitT/TauT family transport system substrate-binding protein
MIRGEDKVVKKPFMIALAALSLGLLGIGCAPQEQPADLVEPLRVGLLPVLDTLPFYIAQEEGYFADEGVEVEAVPVASPVERDQLMQAGEIDGMLNEMTSTAIFNREGVRVQSLITARAAQSDGPVFRVLSAPQSGLTTPADLAGVPVGISENTVIEYTTDRMLEAEGLTPEAIVGESVPVIPERFQLLLEGQIQAATLPDPLAQAALQAGANLVIDDSSYPQYSVSLMTFSVDSIQNNAVAVRRFLVAWDRAVQDLNANPDDYRALFLEKVPVPESVQETYVIPPFPVRAVPTEAQWDDVIAWLLDKGLLDEALPYADSINPDFLPRGY